MDRGDLLRELPTTSNKRGKGMSYLETLTDKQLIRLWNKVLAKINQQFAGGRSFGIDLPTLWAVCPEWAKVYLTLRQEGKRRRDRLYESI